MLQSLTEHRKGINWALQICEAMLSDGDRERERERESDGEIREVLLLFMQTMWVFQDTIFVIRVIKLFWGNPSRFKAPASPDGRSRFVWPERFEIEAPMVKGVFCLIYHDIP